MLRNVTHAILPQVVNVTFVAAPEPLTPPPPKTVPLVQPKQSFVPPLPQVHIAQTEPTITLPPRQRPASRRPLSPHRWRQPHRRRRRNRPRRRRYRAWSMCACHSRFIQASRAAWARPAWSCCVC
jgi:hypothetical protein